MWPTGCRAISASEFLPELESDTGCKTEASTSPVFAESRGEPVHHEKENWFASHNLQGLIPRLSFGLPGLLAPTLPQFTGLYTSHNNNVIAPRLFGLLQELSANQRLLKEFPQVPCQGKLTSPPTFDPHSNLFGLPGLSSAVKCLKSKRPECQILREPQMTDLAEL